MAAQNNPGSNTLDWDELPLVLNIWPDMAKVLGISKNTAFDLAHQSSFPLVRIGRRMKVTKDGLKNWLAKQSSQAEGK